MKYAALIGRLDEAADRLTEQVLAKMLENPFWVERFGERARRHGRQDGRFHIDYLTQALQSGDPHVMEHYARWLQQVLTTRGMCTRHIAENFERLAQALADEKWPDVEAAIAMLGAAARALRYSSGAAREIQEHASVIVGSAVDVLYVRHPEWQSKWGDEGRQRCADDVAYHVSYVADAVALDTPDIFTKYLAWVADFLERRGIPRPHLVESLEVLAAAPDANTEMRRVLSAGLASLRT